jgi:hypothetical protein
MKYALEMGSGDIICITKFHKDWFSHSEVNGRGDKRTQKYRQHGEFISLLLFFNIRRVG